MKSWFAWPFRRATQHSTSDEEYSLPGATKTSLNADVSYDASASEQVTIKETRNTVLEAPVPSTSEEGVVFAKNNVLLRIASASPSPRHKNHRRSDEESGYFYMRSHEISFHGSSYMVHWVANSELKRVTTQETNDTTAVVSNCTNNTLSIEVNNLEMVKIFYAQESEQIGAEFSLSNGQVVFYNKNGVFHIFKFISGGLERFTELLRSCRFLKETSPDDENDHQRQVTFVVYAPQLGLKEMHPSEYEVQTQLNLETWNDLHDREGRVTALKLIQKVVFFRGVSGNVRKEVWPFLLGIFPWKSTTQERLQMMEGFIRDYKVLLAKKGTLRDEAEEAYKEAEILIDKDVVRTKCADESSSNPHQHVELLRSVLLAYVLYDPMVSYTQGMTDLLAPLLLSLEDEVMAFWCFTRLVEQSVFFKPASVSICMESQLKILRPLTKLLLPQFYQYLQSIYHGTDFLFCHRWLLVSFKREFMFEDALLVWEACWIKYETPYFHLFVCIAIMAMYGMKAVEKSLGLDELIVHFNSLSPSMPANIVLSQARGFLYQFQQLKEAPCSLRLIFDNLDAWDRPGRPKLVCKCTTNCLNKTWETSTPC